MLVFVCTEGIARVGDGGGVIRYDDLDEIARTDDVPPVMVDMTVAQVTRALANVGKPRWRRALDKISRQT
jgi:hypothetical protein